MGNMHCKCVVNQDLTFLNTMGTCLVHNSSKTLLIIQVVTISKVIYNKLVPNRYLNFNLAEYLGTI